MAITLAVNNRFKQRILEHHEDHVYKALAIKTGHTGAYNKSSLQVGTPGSGAPSTTNVGTDAVAASGSYGVNGVTLASLVVNLAGDTATVDWGDFSLTGFTGSIDGWVLYNSSLSGDNIVATLPASNAPVQATAGTVAVTVNGVVSLT
jgi:hypothetical protein